MSSRFRICALAFCALLAAILLATISATLALHTGVSESLRGPFRLICHGIASHSLSIAGTPMPLCARCFGIYAGGLLGIGIAAMSYRRRFRMDTAHLFVALVPIVVDGGTQALRLRESTNELRLATGIVAGAAFLLWVMQRIQVENRNVEADRPADLAGAVNEPNR
jgi:uncharacterized membrane protein